MLQTPGLCQQATNQGLQDLGSQSSMERATWKGGMACLHDPQGIRSLTSLAPFILYLDSTLVKPKWKPEDQRDQASLHGQKVEGLWRSGLEQST